MARKCYVKTCPNTYKKTKNIFVIDAKKCSLTIITYHSFPRQPHLRQKWIEATGRTDWQPTNGSFICSDHFKESDYEIIKQTLPENDDQPTQVKRILKRNAVPTQQLAKVLRLEDTHVHANNIKEGVSSDSELSVLSDDKNEVLLPHGNNVDLSRVKEEPNSQEEELKDEQHPPFIITSAVTVKEENDHSDKHNGILESQLSPAYCSTSNHVDSRCDYNYLDLIRPKRLKHQDSLIAPEDIKVEDSAEPLSFNSNLTIEEKYERLLDEFLKLKRDYDFLKFKFDYQRDAISKCEQILNGCR